MNHQSITKINDGQVLDRVDGQSLVGIGSTLARPFVDVHALELYRICRIDVTDMTRLVLDIFLNVIGPLVAFFVCYLSMNHQ